MLSPDLPGDVTARLRATPLDWRLAYAGLQAGRLAIFPSDLAATLGEPAWTPDGLATIDSWLEPLRGEPTHRSEQVSEIREGEWLTLLTRRDGWALVTTEDGYVGWAADWSIVEQTSRDRQALVDRRLGRFGHPRGTLWSSDHWAEATLGLGQPLFVPADGERRRGDFVFVATASGREGWIEQAQLDTAAPTASPAHALRVVRQLLGTPYRWGGRTPLGFDCSGLTQFAWEQQGVALPRDSSQQSSLGIEVGRQAESWAAGDLVFFDDPATHVGLYDGRGHLLHCRGRVRRDALDRIPELMQRCSGVRRIDPVKTQRTPSVWLRPATADPTHP